MEYDDEDPESHKRHFCDTSRAAYDSVDHETVMDAIYTTLDEIPGGQTCDELEIALEMRHQTCSASITKLIYGGHLFDTGKRRPTRSGRQARVYITRGNLEVQNDTLSPLPRSY